MTKEKKAHAVKIYKGILVHTDKESADDFVRELPLSENRILTCLRLRFKEVYQSNPATDMN